MLLGTVSPARATTYDAAADFEAGWLSNSNPNDVWSYCYSASLGGEVTLYTTQITGADSPNQQMWITSDVNSALPRPPLGLITDRRSTTETLPRQLKR